MTDSMVVDSTMGVSMVDMEGIEVGMRGREFGSRGRVETFGDEGGDCGRGGNLAGLASLSMIITCNTICKNFNIGHWLDISDLESALNC